MTTAAVDQLLGLLEQLRGAGRLGRAKILTQSVRQLRSLTVQQRRQVAVEVARQVAPEVADRIEAHGGELTPMQINEFVSLIQKLDNDQLAAVATAVRAGDLDDPAVRAMAAHMGEAALDHLAPPAQDPLDLAPPATLPDDPTIDDEQEVAEATNERVDEEVSIVPVPVSETIVAEDFARTTTDAVQADDHAPDGLTDVEAEAEAQAEMAADVAGRAASAAAAPDGWRRRRLLMDLAREDLIADDEAVTLAMSLGRESDRIWLAGLLVDRGLLLVEDALPLLGERAATRLRNRKAA